MITVRSLRNKRRWRITSARWQRRAIFLLGGIVVGAAAVALAQLADLAQHAFRLLLGYSRYAVLLVTPLGFMLSGAIAAMTPAHKVPCPYAGLPSRNVAED